MPRPPALPLRWWGTRGSGLVPARTHGPPACRLPIDAPGGEKNSGPHICLFNLINNTTSKGDPATHNTMSELTVVQETPRWVSELCSPPPFRPKASGIPDPPGYPSQAPTSSKVRTHTGLCFSARPKTQLTLYCRLQKKDAAKDAKPPRKQPTPEEMDTLKLKKAWEVALAPVKSLPMTAIMMYMTGNTLQIFSIMMVFMAFKNPLVGLVATNQAFERFETESNKAKMVQVKLAYVAMQLVALAVGVWKINAMGLLPFVTFYLSLLLKECPRIMLTRGRTTRSDWLAWEAQREPLESAAVAL